MTISYKQLNRYDVAIIYASAFVHIDDPEILYDVRLHTQIGHARGSRTQRMQDMTDHWNNWQRNPALYSKPARNPTDWTIEVFELVDGQWKCMP